MCRLGPDPQRHMVQVRRVAVHGGNLGGQSEGSHVGRSVTSFGQQMTFLKVKLRERLNGQLGANVAHVQMRAKFTCFES